VNKLLSSGLINENTPFQILADPALKNTGVNVLVKREDLNNQFLSGNKWHKLKYNLLEAKEKGFDKLLTFGGAFSNHIYAVSAAGRLFGFKTIGVIRGEEHLPLNATLNFAKSRGMKLHYIDRKTYRQKYDNELLKSFHKMFGKFYLIPEGGTNKLAVQGVAEFVSKFDVDYDFLCCPCGTGGTLAGLIKGTSKEKQVLGFSVLKGGDFLSKNVEELIYTDKTMHYPNWIINLDYHFGGYAKINSQLVHFIKKFEEKNHIPVEPIYSGKMFYGIYDLILKGFFPVGSTILAFHTGGLQGIEGMREKIKKNIVCTIN